MLCGGLRGSWTMQVWLGFLERRKRGSVSPSGGQLPAVTRLTQQPSQQCSPAPSGRHSQAAAF